MRVRDQEATTHWLHDKSDEELRATLECLWSAQSFPDNAPYQGDSLGARLGPHYYPSLSKRNEAGMVFALLEPRLHGIYPDVSCACPKDFMGVGKERLARDMVRDATRHPAGAKA